MSRLISTTTTVSLFFDSNASGNFCDAKPTLLSLRDKGEPGGNVPALLLLLLLSSPADNGVVSSNFDRFKRLPNTKNFAYFNKDFIFGSLFAVLGSALKAFLNSVDI